MAIHTCLVTYIYLVTYICPTKFSGVGFCPTKFKLCPTKIKSDRTNVLSSQIFICSPDFQREHTLSVLLYSNESKINIHTTIVFHVKNSLCIKRQKLKEPAQTVSAAYPVACCVFFFSFTFFILT